MWGPKKVEEEIDRVYGREVAGRKEFDIFIKDYLDRDGEQRTAKPRSMWLDGEVNTEVGGKLLKLILGKKTLEYPKPVGLIKRILRIASEPTSIVLDSFAGSAPTAQAVLELNREDGGNRCFILVECEDYADSITAERVRRVIKGVKGAKDENLLNGLGGTFSYFELGKPIDTERILKGKDLPSFVEMARYIFYTSTGEEFNEKKIDEKSGFIGESKEYKIYLLYRPDLEYLKTTALTLERAQGLGKPTGKKRLVFAPMKYLDNEHLDRFNIEFAQLPFEIYQK
jgi:adenine-specific DNA-methyltransferase